MVYSLGQALRCMLQGWAIKMCDLSLLVRTFPSSLMLPRTYLFQFSFLLRFLFVLWEAWTSTSWFSLAASAWWSAVHLQVVPLEEKRIHSKCENLVFIPPPLSVGRRCRTDGPARSAEFTTTGLCWILARVNSFSWILAWVNLFSTLSRKRQRRSQGNIKAIVQGLIRLEMWLLSGVAAALTEFIQD